MGRISLPLYCFHIRSEAQAFWVVASGAKTSTLSERLNKTLNFLLVPTMLLFLPLIFFSVKCQTDQMVSSGFYIKNKQDINNPSQQAPRRWSWMM